MAFSDFCRWVFLLVDLSVAAFASDHHENWGPPSEMDVLMEQLNWSFDWAAYTFPPKPPYATSVTYFYSPFGSYLNDTLPKFCMDNKVTGRLCHILCHRLINNFPWTGCECQDVSGGAYSKRGNTYSFEGGWTQDLGEYKVQCNGALEHSIADTAWLIPRCVKVEYDSWGVFDHVDKDAIERYMKKDIEGFEEEEEEEERFDWNGPESQLCRQILTDWRSAGDIWEECRRRVRHKILSMNVSESQKSVECRGAAMRRENWRGEWAWGIRSLWR